MANTYDPVDRVNVGDPTLKAHYDQLLMNAVVVALITGRTIGRCGSLFVWNDQTTWTPVPEGYPFKLPANVDVAGLTVQVACFMQTELAGQQTWIRLEYWDGIAWVSIASSQLQIGSPAMTYLETTNIQSFLFSQETQYRFTSSVSVAGQRCRGTMWVTVHG